MTLKNILRTSCCVPLTLGLLASAGCGDDPAPPDLGSNSLTQEEIQAQEEARLEAERAAGGAPNMGPGPSGVIIEDDEPVSPSEMQLDDKNTCNGVVVANEPVPVDIYVMLDQSQSMSKPLSKDNPQTRWEGVVDALRSFVRDPRAAGMSIGLQYFGLTVPDDCDPMKYSVPAVPIGELPGAAGAIEASLDAAKGPSTLTPTYPAVEGALMHATKHAAENPHRTTIVLLLTDGIPYTASGGKCNDSVNAIANLAKGPAELETGNVRTYLMGVADGLSNLKTIAQAGQGQAFFVEQGNIKDTFAQALLDIRSRPLNCDFPIPEARDGVAFDKTKVQLWYTPDDGVGRVIAPVEGDGSSCGVVGDGWYFDDPVNPTRIFTCKQTCSGFYKGRLDVKFGCPTKPPAK